eukprot:4488487-Amphidinium_carterae.1
MSELKLLPPAAVIDLAQFLKTVELTGECGLSNSVKCFAYSSPRMVLERPGSACRKCIDFGVRPVNKTSRSGVKGAV